MQHIHNKTFFSPCTLLLLCLLFGACNKHEDNSKQIPKGKAVIKVGLHKDAFDGVEILKKKTANTNKRSANEPQVQRQTIDISDNWQMTTELIAETSKPARSRYPP